MNDILDFDGMINDYAKLENGEQRIAELTTARDRIKKMAEALGGYQEKIKADEEALIKSNAVAEELRRINGQLLSQVRVSEEKKEPPVTEEMRRAMFSYNRYNK